MTQIMQDELAELDGIVTDYFAKVDAWRATLPPVKRMRRTFQIETSQFSPRARWVPGAEFYEEDCTVEYPAYLDHLDTDMLESMAIDGEGGVCFVNVDKEIRAAKRQGWRIADRGGMLCDCDDEAQEAGWHACREWQRKHPDAAQRAAVTEDARALAGAVAIVFNVPMIGLAEEVTG